MKTKSINGIKRFTFLFILFYLFPISNAASGTDLLSARKGFSTTISYKKLDQHELIEPAHDFISIIKYDTPIGKMSAYLTDPRKSNNEKSITKYPAIIWIMGGFPSGGAGSSVWTKQPIDNDQSAKNYWQNNIVMLYPTLRGSFGNPGKQEGFYGEVDDILGALKYIEQLDYVDKEKIYLGGHSTGGTLALLVASATDKFAGVIAFGAVADPQSYGFNQQLHDSRDKKENYLRAPINFINSIKTPTFIMEGKNGNIESFNKLQDNSNNKKLKFAAIPSGDHFDILYPLNKLFAEKIKNNTFKNLSTKELIEYFLNHKMAIRESNDIKTIAHYRSLGYELSETYSVDYYLYSLNKEDLQKAGQEPEAKQFKSQEIKSYTNSKGTRYYGIVLSKDTKLGDLQSMFTNSENIEILSERHKLQYQGWDIN